MVRALTTWRTKRKMWCLVVHYALGFWSIAAAVAKHVPKSVDQTCGLGSKHWTDPHSILHPESNINFREYLILTETHKRHTIVTRWFETKLSHTVFSLQWQGMAKRRIATPMMLAHEPWRHSQKAPSAIQRRRASAQRMVVRPLEMWRFLRSSQREIRTSLDFRDPDLLRGACQCYIII